MDLPDRSREPPLEAPPDDAMSELLPRDVRRELAGTRHPGVTEVWYGVVWSWLARGDLAWAWWQQTDEADLRPWIEAERGRTLRELGLHDAAEAHDLAGLEEALDIVDVVTLRLGLVANAIGRGDVDTARLRFDAVAPMVAALEPTPRAARQRLRCSWVELELAILEGQHRTVEGLPYWDPEEGAMLTELYAHGSPFHAAKGLLFAGIASDDGRLLDAAADIAPPILRWAVELARHDRSREGALANAREAWQTVVAPPGYEQEASGTPTALRLTEAIGTAGQPRSEGSSTRAPSSS